MSVEGSLRGKKCSVGTKQTTRLVESGRAAEVFVARDADPRMIQKIEQLCKKMGVRITYVDSMKQLGKACGIDVGAAMAAVANE